MSMTTGCAADAEDDGRDDTQTASVLHQAAGPGVQPTRILRPGASR
jgi:hypothetical protein